MLLYFVRHGHPDYANDCLTELGRKQATAVAERLKNCGIEQIYSSSNGRALQTAMYTAKALDLQVPFRLIRLVETLLVSAACCVLFHCMNIILLEQPGLIYIIQCILTDTDFGPCFFACDYQSKRFRNALDAIPDNQEILI